MICEASNIAEPPSLLDRVHSTTPRILAQGENGAAVCPRFYCWRKLSVGWWGGPDADKPALKIESARGGQGLKIENLWNRFTLSFIFCLKNSLDFQFG